MVKMQANALQPRPVGVVSWRPQRCHKMVAQHELFASRNVIADAGHVVVPAWLSCRWAAAHVIAMKATNIAISACVIALLMGCASTEDRTTGKSSTCEVHGEAMTSKRVAETFGMKPLNPIETARRQVFPHADEPYDTGACIRSYDYARIYICSACTEARKQWLLTQSQSP